MQSLFSEVEKELPLSLERETDCRETWPKRWALLKAKVEKLTASNKQSTQNYACPKCGAWLSTIEYRTGECHSCHRAVSA